LIFNYLSSTGYHEAQDIRLEEVLPGSLVQGMDSNSNLITSVIPTRNAAPAGAGLYLGADYMGFYNGTVWKTYMDNCSNFYLGGSAVGGCGLAWNAATNCLTVCGCITSCAGTIGGWNLTNSAIATTTTPECGWISIGDWHPSYSAGGYRGSIFVGNGTFSACGVISIGTCLRLFSGFTNLYSGISITSPTGQVFRATADRATGANFCGILAGWDFNAACLYKGNLILNSAGSITGNYTAGSAGWCISSTGAAEFNNVTVRGTVYATSGSFTGTVCACAGCIGGFTINNTEGLYSGTGATRVQMKSGTGFWAGADAFASAPFSVTPAGVLKATNATITGTICACAGCIAGWNFNAACLYKGNLILNSAGSISGCYNGDSTGWCIDAAGNAKFNNATVRGTVCASCGAVGCYSIISGALVGTFPTSETNGIVVKNSGYCAHMYPEGFYACRCYSSTKFIEGHHTYKGISFITCCTSPQCYITVGMNSYGISLGTNAAGTSVCSSILMDATATTNAIEITMYGGRLCNMLCGKGSIHIDGNLKLISSAAAATDICFRADCMGNTSATAPLLINLIGDPAYGESTTCFAMCTNGRIQVSGTVYPSDRNLKTDFSEESVLGYLRCVPIYKFRYKGSENYQYGPVAQEFNPIFKLSHDWQTNLTVSGIDGIALKAAKEIDENVQVHDKCIDYLKNENSTLKEWIANLSEKITNLETRMDNKD